MEPRNSANAIHPVEIFKSAFRMWRNNLSLFCGIFLIIMPALIARIIFVLSVKPPQATPSSAEIMGLMLKGAAVFILEFCLFTWVTIASILAASQAQEGKKSGAAEYLHEARQYFWKYIFACLLTLVVMTGISFGGLMLSAILSGIFFSMHQNLAGAVALLLVALPTLFGVVYFMIRWGLYGPACVLENLPPWAALERSRSLLDPRVNPFVGVCLLFLGALILSFAPDALFYGVMRQAKTAHMVVVTVYHFIANLLFLPLWACISVIFFTRAKQAEESS
jgi:hypothetical protein